MREAERVGNYLEYLKIKANPDSRKEYAVIQFYKGHFFQQLANNSGLRQDARHFQEKALCYYQTYLEISDCPDESKYYAQWQVGMLQDKLNYPWKLAEDALITANAIDPLRGEATKKIIEHYLQYKEWNEAYHYSAIAMDRFFDKNPVAKRKWFVDFDAYNWNVVRRHRNISYKLSSLTANLPTNGTINQQTIPQQC